MLLEVPDLLDNQTAELVEHDLMRRSPDFGRLQELVGAFAPGATEPDPLQDGTGALTRAAFNLDKTIEWLNAEAEALEPGIKERMIAHRGPFTPESEPEPPAESNGAPPDSK